MTNVEAEKYYAAAPKDAIAYVKTTAAAYLAQRGTIAEPLQFEAAARDAFVMACALASKFWPVE